MTFLFPIYIYIYISGLFEGYFEVISRFFEGYQGYQGYHKNEYLPWYQGYQGYQGYKGYQGYQGYSSGSKPSTCSMPKCVSNLITNP